MTRNVENASDVSVKATRAFSKALFGGAQYRIEIGAAICEKAMANTLELSDELGISKQSVNQELRLLERVGLLTRTDWTGDSGRKVYLTKEPSGYWEFCREAALKAEARLRGARPF